MSKKRGTIGFADYSEKAPGVWKKDITEETKTLEITKKDYRYATVTTSTNDDLVANMQVSIIVDPAMVKNFPQAVYIEIDGTKWKVTSADSSKPPRVTFMLGEVYRDVDE